MRLSTKGRYAVTAIINLALNPDKLISLSDISESQSISVSYLEQLFSKLKKYNLVKGVRGPGGGYKLARPASEISVADIINAVNEKLDATRCNGHGNCHNGCKCITHELWCNLSTQIYHFLHNLSLQDLVDDARKMEKAKKENNTKEISAKIPIK